MERRARLEGDDAATVDDPLAVEQRHMKAEEPGSAESSPTTLGVAPAQNQTSAPMDVDTAPPVSVARSGLQSAKKEEERQLLHNVSSDSFDDVERKSSNLSVQTDLSAPSNVLVETPGLRHNMGLALSEGSPAPQSNTDGAPQASCAAHVVPPGFRGPIPREGDAEELAPRPAWVPAAANASLGTLPNFPMNKGGWRYTAAGPAAHILSETVYRTIEFAPASTHWSWQDRSAFTRISEDALIVGAEKGFRSARTNVGVRHGAWYVELEILPPDASSIPSAPMRDGPHVRVGWARREASLNAPVGWDGYSYGLRDVNGARVTQSQPHPFGRAFGPGDVVGMYIRLPERGTPPPVGSEAGIHQKRIPIRYKGQLYFETLEYPTSKEMDMLMDTARRGDVPRPGAGARHPGQEARRPPPRPLPTLDSCIGFVINGEPQGIAFTELFDFRPLAPAKMATKKRRQDEEITAYTNVSTILKSRQNAHDDGTLGYYVMASMYGGARVRLITENFRYPPPANLEDTLWRVSATPRTRQHAAPPWLPLAARFAEACEEAHGLDLGAEADARNAKKHHRAAAD